MTGRRTAIYFVVLLGVVSLFADMTYEGGRSIMGPLLAQLGASAAVVGLVAGLGELVGYGLRLVSGYWSDRTQRYWAITIAGYCCNLFAVPLLALAGRWEVAALLMLLERAGKAMRNPPRNAMLAHATTAMGRGWGFGLHEAMDQAGALIGPLIVAAVLHARGGYSRAFALLLLPALCSIGTLLAARRLYPRPSELEVKPPMLTTEGIPRVFWIYVSAAALVAVGYADFSLIAYHFAKAGIVPVARIPILYALGMGTAAVSALASGWLFDRVGMLAIILGSALATAATPLVFKADPTFVAVGMALWGVGLGVQESAMLAALADMLPAARRGSGFGLFGAAYGLAWFAGSATMGILYGHSVRALIAFSVAAQLAALPVFVLTAIRQRRAT